MAEEVAGSAPAVEESTDPIAPPEPVAEPEAAAPEEGEEPAPSETESESQDESVSASDAAKQERSDRDKRIDESVKRLNIENRDLKRQLRSIQQQYQQMPQLLKEPVEPQLENYDDVAVFKKDMAKFKDELKAYSVQQDRVEREQRSRAEAQQKQMTELRATWEKRAQRVLKDKPDFNVVEALGRIEPSPTMDGFFADSEAGPEMVDYFDTNPEEADRFREMTPFMAVRELHNLEIKLLNQVKGIKAKPALVKPPAAVSGRASAPAAPRTAADILYG